MEKNILQAIDARTKFIKHLEEGIKRNNETLECASKDLKKLQETNSNIVNLGKYPEHESLIPLGKNIYMKGTIVHTGEYYIKKNVSTESYLVLKTLEQTLDSLQEEIKSKEKDIVNIESTNVQLEERMRFLSGEGVGISEKEEEEVLPKEIKSDKGVAVKVGEFYEILEFQKD